jgi:two-component system, LytTR family, response regulator LytT
MNPQRNCIRIVIPTPSSMELVAPEKIVYCQAEEKQVHIKVYPDRQLFTSISLKKIEEKLSAFPFYRCHANSLVNLAYVQSYCHKTGEIVMEDGAKLRVAKDRKSSFYDLIRSDFGAG